jgi:hypothetical protein
MSLNDQERGMLKQLHPYKGTITSKEPNDDATFGCVWDFIMVILLYGDTIIAINLFGKNSHR